MGISVLISIFLHLGLVAIAYFGIPSLGEDVVFEAPIKVEIVNVEKTTNVPSKQIKKEKKVDVETPKQEVKVVPKSEQKIKPILPEELKDSVIVPTFEAKPKPKPKPVVKEKPKAPAELVKLKPKRKPKPQNNFDAVLRTIADLTTQSAEGKVAKTRKKKPNTKTSFEEQITKALGTEQRNFDQSKVVSISEIDHVRQQITKCWSPPAGAKDAHNMIIEIAVSMNLDGTVRDAKINNKGLQADTFLRAMAESALRAVLNKHCQPFKLPREKFDRWKTMTLVFNPKEMLGG